MKIVFNVFNKDYDLLGQYSYLSKVNEQSTQKSKRIRNAYLNRKMIQLLDMYEKATEVNIESLGWFIVV